MKCEIVNLAPFRSLKLLTSFYYDIKPFEDIDELWNESKWKKIFKNENSFTRNGAFDFQLMKNLSEVYKDLRENWNDFRGNVIRQFSDDLFYKKSKDDLAFRTLTGHIYNELLEIKKWFEDIKKELPQNGNPLSDNYYKLIEDGNSLFQFEISQCNFGSNSNEPIDERIKDYIDACDYLQLKHQTKKMFFDVKISALSTFIPIYLLENKSPYSKDKKKNEKSKILFSGYAMAKYIIEHPKVHERLTFYLSKDTATIFEKGKLPALTKLKKKLDVSPHDYIDLLATLCESFILFTKELTIDFSEIVLNYKNGNKDIIIKEYITKINNYTKLKKKLWNKNSQTPYLWQYYISAKNISHQIELDPN